MLSQMTKGNPQMMIQNMIKSNPQLQQAWNITQQIMSKGGTPQEMINQACKVSNTNSNEVMNTLQNNGIKF